MILLRTFIGQMLYPFIKEKKVINMLWTIAVILFVLWLLGLIGNIGGGLIHILLVIAVIVILYNLFVRGRRSRI